MANNHIPYRRDCAVCVHGAGLGRRHAGVAHPDAYCMSADVAGPIRTPGRDPESRNHGRGRTILPTNPSESRPLERDPGAEET